MKRALSIFMTIMLLSAVLTACTAGNEGTVSTPPSAAPADLSNTYEASETPDAREGQPIPTNIVPESYAGFPMDSSFFTDTADIFAKVPDIAAAIRDTPARMSFRQNELEAVYSSTDVNTAISDVEAMLLHADFIKVDKVNAQLDLHSALESGELVYLRAIDGIFVSLEAKGGNLVARYVQSNSYFVDGQPVTIEPTGGDGSNYKGALFDRTPFDYIAERYGSDVPEPNNPLGTPAHEIFIDGDIYSAGYFFKINNPDARAESFKMTMEDAGFTTENFTVENSTYTKGSIKVALEITKETSGFSEATVTLTTLSGFYAGDPALRYESSALGIGIVFPPEYKGKYAIAEHDNNFCVVHKVSNEALNKRSPDTASNVNGTLFWVIRMPLSEAEEVLNNVGGILILKTDEYGYLFRRPTDVQYDDSDQYGLSETEYHALYSDRLAQFIIDSTYLLKE